MLYRILYEVLFIQGKFAKITHTVGGFVSVRGKK